MEAWEPLCSPDSSKFCFFSFYGKDTGQVFMVAGMDEPPITHFKCVLFIGTYFYSYFLIPIHEDILNHCICLPALLPFWLQPSLYVCPEKPVQYHCSELLCCNVEQVLFKEKGNGKNIHTIYFSYLFILLKTEEPYKYPCPPCNEHRDLLLLNWRI